MTTRELDSETAAICIQRSTHHPDYEALAARIYVSDLHKRTALSPLALMRAAATARTPMRYAEEYCAILERLGDPALAAFLDPARDFNFRYFGYQTLTRGYLMRPGGRLQESSLLDEGVMERPQHLYARVALGVFVGQPGRDGHRLDDDAFAACLRDAKEYYDALSCQLISNATPTMLNSGTPVPQLSSCFQLATGDDLPELADTLKSAMLTSKWSGGLSVWLHNVRAEGAPIVSTGGRSTGIKRYVRILNDAQNYVDQGGNRPGAFAVYLSVDHADVFEMLSNGRLKGAPEELKAADLKYGLWVPDRFMAALRAQLANDARVARGGRNDPTAGDWYLFCPKRAPGLYLVYDDRVRGTRAYSELYDRYVAEKRYSRRVKAGDIIAEAFKMWQQNGTPYVLYKDNCNAKSNMINVAIICSSNLCVEILIPSWSKFDALEFARLFHPGNAGGGETGVCNLASVCLSSHVGNGPSPGPQAAAMIEAPRPAALMIEAPTPAAVMPPMIEAPKPAAPMPPMDEASKTAARMPFMIKVPIVDEKIVAGSRGAAWVRPRIEWARLERTAGLGARALNKVIDINSYPTEEGARSNRRHRPIGLGIMGAADVLARLRLAYSSPAARGVMRGIAATIYYGALCESAAAAERDGPYATFKGSPASQGLLQPDLWVRASDLAAEWEAEVERLTEGFLTPAKWAALRARIMKTGLRNAYVTAYMPTASSASIVGQNEGLEPYTSQIYVRRTQGGEFFVVNAHLIAELEEAGIWSDSLRREILAAGGSVKNIEHIPAEIRARYLTAREIHPTRIIQMTAAVAPFVDQSISMNMYTAEPSLPKILRFLLEGHAAGLKTGMYYCHTAPATGSQKTSLRVSRRRKAGAGASAPPARQRASAQPDVTPDAAAGASCSLKHGCTSCGT
jgi:ribonucleoside-diphosphate reductase alpha subunit